jgi:hypothetical protein
MEYENLKNEIEEVSANNMLSSCCKERVVYGGGMKQVGEFFVKAPILRICEKCRNILSEVEKPENEIENFLNNY